MKMIDSSELIINSDGSVFHLHLRPDQLSKNIILCGDPGRVDMIAEFLHTKEFRIQNREFVSVTGEYNHKRITILSTGIGTDNIDIVLNELDALANIDFETREIKKEKTSLNIIRIGTCGGLQKNLETNDYIISKKAIGFDGLLNFYQGRENVSDKDFENKFKEYVKWNSLLTTPYVVSCSPTLYKKINSDEFYSGITISAPGFYGPQGRILRLNIVDPDINKKIEAFSFKGEKITNYEMECSAIYGLSALLGHNALTVCMIIANRLKKNANTNYHERMKNM
ncbi:MAG: nucleoside phosphorylase, partial [Prolixibacteraceae bacterium]|nr:nucleoside phosphorylase [Prolixibacteraceae bacterium]